MKLLTFTDLLVMTISAVLIISKFLDCYTTHKNIHLGEGNPMVSRFMNKYGPKTVIWSIFTLVLLIVIPSAAYYFLYPDLFYGISFVLLGTVASVFHFAVAHYNYNLGLDREVSNPMIKMTQRLHLRLGKIKWRK